MYIKVLWTKISILNDKGYIIEAEKPIYVSVRLQSQAQAGAIVSKGRAALSNSFVFGGFVNNTTRGNTPYNSFFSVMAIEDGTEITDGAFPYETGDQIWGSIASADLDQDGFIDFIVPSKNKHLYIFDINGLKTDYDAQLFLVGTPAIGNIDDDNDLEVVFSGYSSGNKLFVINSIQKK